MRGFGEATISLEKGGQMPGSTSETGDEPGSLSAAQTVDESFCFEGSVADGQFAVIHDEPFITIVFENGLFWGCVVEGTEAKLERALLIASQYNLQMVALRLSGRDYHLRFTEVHESSN